MIDRAPPGEHYLALCGGVGGAKLALGLARVLPPEALTIVVNTGDDFMHLGLHISPDIDTVVYTLGDLANPDLGWGRHDETWSFMATLEDLGGPTWFRLGDRDLAMHIERTRRLSQGQTLSEVTSRLAARLGIGPAIVPMSDDPVRTIVETDQGRLAFQDYFVARRCKPRVRRIVFEGAGTAEPAAAGRAALADPSLAGIIICPSNPWLSIDPILAVAGWREALLKRRVPVIAITPIVGGRAIKGPTAKIMGELGVAADTAAILDHYGGLIDGLISDEADAPPAPRPGITLAQAPTVMRTLDDRMRLAEASLEFCRRLKAAKE